MTIPRHTLDKITVLVVEDHPIFRDALRGYIETQSDRFLLLGETDSGAEAVSLVDQLVPDVVIFDLELRDVVPEDCGQIIGAIRSVSPTTRVVVLSGYDGPRYVFAAIKAGADTYMLKQNVQPADVTSMIEQIHQGTPPLDPDIGRRLYEYFQNGSATLGDEPSRSVNLTERELDVLKCIVQHKSNREIAEELVISEKTVKTHVSNMLQKLHLANRTELRMYAFSERPELGSAPRGAVEP